MGLIIKGIPLRAPKNGGIRAKQKWFNFSVNQYRNAHFLVLNNAKRWFYEWAVENIQHCKKPLSLVRLEYTLYLKKQSDLMNFACVVDKFLQDALVKLGYFQDDNSNIVKQCFFNYGGYDKIGFAECEVVDLSIK